jgi:membrane protease YdiL (CAAX protease family)
VRHAGSWIGYFALTYAVTWTFWTLSSRVSLGAGPPQPMRTVLLYLGTFSPAFVALTLTAFTEGRAGVRAILRRLIRADVPVRYYAFALGFMAAIKLTAAVVHRAALGAWPPFGRDPWWGMIAATLFSTLIGGQTGEEIGWRGYVLPRMAEDVGLGLASILLGILWALWHLPLFFFPGADTRGQSLPLYVIQVTAISVAMAWLYWRTHGSLLLTMLLHAAINNTKDIVPSRVAGASNPFALSSSVVGWITAALLWIVAAWLLTSMRHAKLAVERAG